VVYSDVPLGVDRILELSHSFVVDLDRWEVRNLVSDVVHFLQR
jgi:hypothetical protein